MKRGYAGGEIADGQCDAEQERDAIERVGCESEGPHLFGVDTRDQDLSVREFEQAGEGGFDVGNRQAIGQEHDGAAGADAARGSASSRR